MKVVPVINFITSQSWIPYLLTVLWDAVGSTHNGVVLCADIQWLSQGKELFLRTSLKYPHAQVTSADACAWLFRTVFPQVDVIEDVQIWPHTSDYHITLTLFTI